jgi:hypothetical protein
VKNIVDVYKNATEQLRIAVEQTPERLKSYMALFRELI